MSGIDRCKAAACAVLAAALAICAACDQSFTAAGRNASPAPGELHTVGPQALARLLEFSGRIGFGNELAFSSDVDGTIRRHVVYGQEVRKGELLVQLVAEDLNVEIAKLEGEWDSARQWATERYPASRELLEQNLRAAERDADIQLREAQAVLDAYRIAHDRGSAKAAEVDLARQDVLRLGEQRDLTLRQKRQEIAALEHERLARRTNADALARLLQSRVAARKKLEIFAPFTGTVVGLADAIGSSHPAVVKRGQYLLTLAELDNKIVRITVSAPEAHYFAAGNPPRCLVRRLMAEVPCSAAGAQPGDDSQRVEVRLEMSDPPPSLQIGELVSVRLPLGEVRAAVAVPIRALKFVGDIEGVLRQEGDSTAFRPVVTGFRNEAAAEIVRGLQAGDQIRLD